MNVKPKENAMLAYVFRRLLANVPILIEAQSFDFLSSHCPHVRRIFWAPVSIIPNQAFRHFCCVL
jgi:hypothetical protein